MVLIYALMIVSILISVAAYFIFKMENKVAAIVAAGSLIVTVLGCTVATYVSTSSVEKLNGEVTGKSQTRVSCSHSYSCNCRSVSSGSGKNRTTSTKCDTCYEHSYDYDWDVYTSVGNLTIDRVDRRGLEAPERWSIVRNGDPVTVNHTYTNWIKPASSSLLNKHVASEKDISKLPKYPGQIYDYYKIDRIVLDGVPLPNVGEMNQYLSDRLKVVGPSKQANIIIVATNKPSQAYATELYSAWKGAEKNDIVVFVGISGNEIRWARVEAWAKSSIFQVKLRDAILDIKTFDMKRIIDTSAQVTTQQYKRKPMKEFEYLKDDLQTITPLASIIIVLLMLLIHSIPIWINRREARKNIRYRY
jgi:hypothetical protein